MKPHPPTNARLNAAALATLILLAGCGDGELADPELELVPERPRTAEVDFGRFLIPVPGYPIDEPDTRNYLQLEFVLFGVVEPSDESEATRLAERNRGELRDSVIKVCRNTSLSELQDPELVTLKLRLIDAAEPVFEGISFDTMLIRDYMLNSL